MKKHLVIVIIFVLLIVGFSGCVDDADNNNNDKYEKPINEVLVGNWTHSSDTFWYIFNENLTFIWFVEGESYHIDGTYRLSNDFIEMAYHIGANEEEFRTYRIEFIRSNTLKLTDIDDGTHNIFNRG